MAFCLKCKRDNHFNTILSLPKMPVPINALCKPIHFRSILSDHIGSVDADLIQTAEYWLMEEESFKDIGKVLLIPKNSLLPPEKSASTFERFELWRQGKEPYENFWT